jgi:hypothetical protein
MTTDLLRGTSTAPGRVRTFLEHPEYGTTPHSCTLIKYDEDPVELIRFVTIALKGGAGVKVIFPAQTNFDLTLFPPKQIHFTIERTHDDYHTVRDVEGFVELEDARQMDECIYLQPLDTIVGSNGILDCIGEIYFYAGSTILVDLSNLRASKVINRWGMESSGPASFADVFQSFHNYCTFPSIGNLLVCLGHVNNTMRRGGYKKGIVTSAMDYICPLIDEYLDIDITLLSGSHKLGIIVDDDILNNTDLVDKVVTKRNSQSLFIEKRIDDKTWMNVCEGIALGDRATCLIWRVNLGLCETNNDIVTAFVNAMESLVKLHLTWRDSKSNPGIYASLANDRQVALDIMGLANCLAIKGIKYAEFVEALEYYVNLEHFVTNDREKMCSVVSILAYDLVCAIRHGYHQAWKTASGIMADANLLPLDRLFTVEPAQSHSYETFDAQGYTTCRGIFAPFGRLVTRNSESETEQIYNHGNVETAGEIGADLQIRLCNAWQQLMNETGVAHGISQDSYKLMDRYGFIEFIGSASKTLYYAEHNNYNQRKHLAKSIAVCTIDDKDRCLSCGE